MGAFAERTLLPTEVAPCGETHREDSAVVVAQSLSDRSGHASFPRWALGVLARAAEQNRDDAGMHPTSSALPFAAVGDRPRARRHPRSGRADIAEDAFVATSAKRGGGEKLTRGRGQRTFARGRGRGVADDDDDADGDGWRRRGC